MERITKQFNDGILTIKIDDAFDLSLFEEFHDAYPKNMVGVRSLVVDLSDTTYVDSSALGMLISVWKLLDEDKSKVTIKGARANVMKMLEIGKMDSLMTVV